MENGAFVIDIEEEKFPQPLKPPRIKLPSRKSRPSPVPSPEPSTDTSATFLPPNPSTSRKSRPSPVPTPDPSTDTSVTLLPPSPSTSITIDIPTSHSDKNSMTSSPSVHSQFLLNPFQNSSKDYSSVFLSPNAPIRSGRSSPNPIKKPFNETSPSDTSSRQPSSVSPSARSSLSPNDPTFLSPNAPIRSGRFSPNPLNKPYNETSPSDTSSRQPPSVSPSARSSLSPNDPTFLSPSPTTSYRQSRPSPTPSSRSPPTSLSPDSISIYTPQPSPTPTSASQMRRDRGSGDTQGVRRQRSLPEDVLRLQLSPLSLAKEEGQLMNNTDFEYNAEKKNTDEQDLSWRRLHMGRAKLRSTASTSELLAGFAMIALVELQINDPTEVPEWLFVVFSVCTTVLVAVHVFALMISTYLIPSVDAVSKMNERGLVDESPHERMWKFIELAWAASTVVGLFLFLVEIVVICWVKFWDFSFLAAWASTVVVVPVLVLFVGFVAFFSNTVRVNRVNRVTLQIEQLEEMKQKLDLAASFHAA